MKKRRLALVGAFGITVTAAITWHWSTGRDQVSPSEHLMSASDQDEAPGAKEAITSSPATPFIPGAPPTKAQIERREARWRQLFHTPITVYGKVIDEHGDPISGATVEIAIVNGVQSTDKDVRKTDDRGLFAVVGRQGLGYSLRASKPGYYTTKQSTAHRNVLTPAKTDSPSSTPQEPTVLVLRKRGITETLLVAKSGQIDVPRDGSIVRIGLAGKPIGTSPLEIASWIGDLSDRRFDWRYRITIPGGGLRERLGQFDFEAPLDGYLSSVEYNMPASAQEWSMDGRKDYFAKLPDGRFARFLIRFYPGRERNFVVIESFMNPTLGHRNLEFEQSIKTEMNSQVD